MQTDLTSIKAELTISLTQGKCALVDAADLAQISQYKWCAARAKNTWYAQSGTSGKSILMHRLILGVTHPEILVDHRNGDGLDNRRCNLRIADRAANAWNSRKHADGKSRFKGVRLCKSGRFEARLMFRGKEVSFGRFTTEVEAAHAYAEGARKYFGTFASMEEIS